MAVDCAWSTRPSAASAHSSLARCHHAASWHSAPQKSCLPQSLQRTAALATSGAAQREVERVVRAFNAQHRELHDISASDGAKKAQLPAGLRPPKFLQEVRWAVINHPPISGLVEAVAADTFLKFESAIKSGLPVLRPCMQEDKANYIFDDGDEEVAAQMPAACCCWRPCCCVCRGLRLLREFFEGRRVRGADCGG